MFFNFITVEIKLTFIYIVYISFLIATITTSQQHILQNRFGLNTYIYFLKASYEKRKRKNEMKKQ